MVLTSVAMTDEPEAFVRRLCLALPETAEKEAWGDPTFRVREKIFAMVKRGDGPVSVWCKAAGGFQEMLIESDPALYFRPPYVGHKGWVGLRLDDDPDPATVDAAIRQSYRLIAPKKLAALLAP